jgi:hypothetical protein
VVVADQPASPYLTYTVALTTGTGESETVTLTESGGLLIGQLPASYDAVATEDGTLQVNLGGEQIRADYRFIPAT